MAKYDRPIPALLLTDFYKTCHRAFYNPETKQLVAYWTPRKSRLEYIDKVVCFGLQAYIKKYLIDRFDDTFFNRPWSDVRQEYVEYISATLDKEIANGEIDAFKRIHEAGFLPILIRAVPEGTLVPIGCPMIEFRATAPWAFWLVNYLETIGSCNLWLPMTDATLAYYNRKLVDEWFERTCEDNVSRSAACGDFSMRGMAGEDAAVMGDAGHLLSFSSTATIGTAWWLRNFYNAPLTVCKGTPSTEHSVAESFGPDREQEMYEYVACKQRPTGILSMVSDTWDLWNVITKELPELKDKLMQRDGKVVIRPDSGDPVDIICGTLRPHDARVMPVDSTRDEISKQVSEWASDAWDGSSVYDEYSVDIRIGNTIRHVVAYYSWDEDENNYTPSIDEIEIGEARDLSPAELGVVELLWGIFGGTVNSKGFKVLDSHIGVIYGDAITNGRAYAIYSRLAEKGFASNNVTLGFGAYTYQYVTRDTFGFALKVTHGVLEKDGSDVEVMMFKDPVTDYGSHCAGKKSQKGMCIVTKSDDGKVRFTDGHTISESDNKENLLRPVFCDGKLLVDDDFETIRRRLHPNF